MKIQQQEEAKDLFFQTNLSKAEIAEKVGVSRKTVLFWAHQGNWTKLRMSARNMPSLIAEKCYYLIDQFVSSQLTDGNSISNMQLRHAQTIHLLAATIKKLKNRNTPNESMEMFSFFLEAIKREDPTLAEQVAPHMEQYISKRKKTETTDHLLEDFNENGTLPYPDQEFTERWADEKEGMEIMSDFENFIMLRNDPETPPTHPQQEAVIVKEPLIPETPETPKKPNNFPDPDDQFHHSDYRKK